MECITPDTVNEAFLVAPPLISQQIKDLTIQHPNWLRDQFEMEEVPRGNGSVVQQLFFRGSLLPVERGFDKWKRKPNLSGCDPCEAPDCSYNWSMLGGHGFERKTAELMSREFRTPDYCVEEIQTTAHFKEVFAKIVENLYRQIDFFKEENIAHNGLTSLAKKYVVDAEGAKPNLNNPYVYRPSGGVRLSTLNVSMLEFFYEHLRRIPDAVPFDLVNGSPIYSILASHQLLSRLYRDDANLRQDVRFSGYANDLLTKYNFMSTIRGMFLAAPILYPRRFDIDEDSGEFVEVLPFVNNVPAEVGTFSYLNPAYEMARFEEVLLHGRSPFKLLYMPTETSLGGGTDFGPEPSFMDNLIWFNPPTQSDPLRRQGFFLTAIKAGFAPQFSEGLFGILVERPSITLMAMYTPNPVCPVDPPTCTNIVPDVSCPCPLVLGMSSNPFNEDSFFFTFTRDIDVADSGPVQLKLDNGAYLTGTVEQISEDGKTAEISFTDGLTSGVCTHIVGVYCDESLGCSAKVALANDCRSNQTGTVSLTLSNPIKATTAGDVVVAYFGDCTTQQLEVVSVNVETLEWVMSYTAGYGPTEDAEGEGDTMLTADILCDRGGIIKLCVPTTTDATCPGCDPVTVTACVEPEEEG